MNRSLAEEIIMLLERGEIETALAQCRAMWEETAGPPAPRGETDFVGELNRRLTVWEQLELYVGEVNRHPTNPRTWKLLGYAYLWGGLYIPVLLRAAEQAFLASTAYEEDPSLLVNLDEKMELCRRALAGEAEARAELAAGGETFARPFKTFPPHVSFPDPFVQAGVASRAELTVTTAVVAPDLLDLLNG
jgi:hypothetical protein